MRFSVVRNYDQCFRAVFAARSNLGYSPSEAAELEAMAELALVGDWWNQLALLEPGSIAGKVVRIAEKKCSKIASVDIVSFSNQLIVKVTPQTVGNYLSHLGAICHRQAERRTANRRSPLSPQSRSATWFRTVFRSRSSCALSWLWRRISSLSSATILPGPGGALPTSMSIVPSSLATTSASPIP